MGLGLTDNQRLENIRICLSLSHDRNKELASYIRITDAGVWGFIGFVFIELFKENPTYDFKLPLFTLILIFSMYLWRANARRYQEDIVKGYIRIVNCENYLDIPYDVTVRKNLDDTIEKDTGTRPRSVSELLIALTSANYNDKSHVKLNFYAFLIGFFGFLVLIYFCYEWMPILGFFGMIVLILWTFKWLSYFKNFNDKGIVHRFMATNWSNFLNNMIPVLNQRRTLIVFSASSVIFLSIALVGIILNTNIQPTEVSLINVQSLSVLAMALLSIGLFYRSHAQKIEAGHGGPFLKMIGWSCIAFFVILLLIIYIFSKGATTIPYIAALAVGLFFGTRVMNMIP
jgi:hypothetical protein